MESAPLYIIIYHYNIMKCTIWRMLFFFLSQTCRSLSTWFFWTPLTAPLRSSRFSALSAPFSALLTCSDFNIQDGWAAKHDQISIKLPPNLLENFYMHSPRALYICVVAWILWHDFFSPDTKMLRLLPAAYGDGVYLPSGEDRPNPHVVASAVFDGETGHPSYRNRTAFLVFFGEQFKWHYTPPCWRYT